MGENNLGGLGTSAQHFAYPALMAKTKQKAQAAVPKASAAPISILKRKAADDGERAAKKLKGVNGGAGKKAKGTVPPPPVESGTEEDEDDWGGFGGDDEDLEVHKK
ncbi:hypothetical protein CALVIDRAFT_536015 [Calocera viscosa TUFC12733]|uniref:Uncharacterized protein n=1 Tax=Calocera viscosa (strain TUFC12733) TaxID=1330018 RepID=A0A167NP33_CALVF|nr:hypothetical protein CALVIDRAFT_536015 [Calocera viscosa TUFC12733]